VFQGDDGGMRGVDADGTKLNEYYFVGVIDILMLYTIRKKAEHVYKSLRFADSPVSLFISILFQ
jgi:1-phosphatidylinositol-4-phosphate 5-kinase